MFKKGIGAVLTALLVLTPLAMSAEAKEAKPGTETSVKKVKKETSKKVPVNKGKEQKKLSKTELQKLKKKALELNKKLSVIEKELKMIVKEHRGKQEEPVPSVQQPAGPETPNNTNEQGDHPVIEVKDTADNQPNDNETPDTAQRSVSLLKNKGQAAAADQQPVMNKLKELNKEVQAVKKEIQLIEKKASKQIDLKVITKKADYLQAVIAKHMKKMK